MKFVPLSKGTFYMGWNGQKGSARKTEIKEDFEIAIHTVTQGQWLEVKGTFIVRKGVKTTIGGVTQEQWLEAMRTCYFSRGNRGKDDVKDIKDEDLKQFPVEGVSWLDAQEFIKKLNEKEKGRGYLYRLPSESEWEYACRGGATSEEDCSYNFYFDKPTNDLSSKQANFYGDPFGKGERGPSLGRPTKVGSYAPNKLGLYDMHGNVWQWCEDPWVGGADNIRVVRGGSWHDGAGGCRAAYRTFHALGFRVWDVGFRLARVPVR
jgi:formylglycine-generating enzyme required for sulfatase activity